MYFQYTIIKFRKNEKKRILIYKFMCSHFYKLNILKNDPHQNYRN